MHLIAKLAISVVLITSFLLLSPSLIYAAYSFQIKSVSPTAINSLDTEIEIAGDILNQSSSYYYHALIQTGTNKYDYGSVQNDKGEWIEINTMSSDEGSLGCKNYFHLAGPYNGEIKFKIKPSKSLENGVYNLKVFRFVEASCNATAAGTFENIDIQVSTPVPTSLPTSTPLPTFIPTSTPVATPTLKPSTTPKSLVKILQPKDEDGKEVSNVKIYVNNNYIHHYAPEELTFCDECKCDTGVECKKGNYIFKFERDGMESYVKNQTVEYGNTYEIIPILSKNDKTTPMPTKLMNIVTPSPQVTPSKTDSYSTTSESLKPMILGVQEKDIEIKKDQVNTKKINPTSLILISLGVFFLVAVVINYVERKRKEREEGEESPN